MGWREKDVVEYQRYVASTNLIPVTNLPPPNFDASVLITPEARWFERRDEGSVPVRAEYRLWGPPQEFIEVTGLGSVYAGRASHLL